MPTYQIRPLSDDAQAQACAAFMAQSDPWLTLGVDYPSLLRTVLAPQRERFVALADGQLAGLLLLNLQGTFAGYLQTLCVAPAFRGLGCGSALVAFAEHRIFQHHANVFLCVSSFNHAAYRLYERLGYTRVGEIPDFLVAGYSELLLRKTRGPLSTFKPSAQAPAPGTADAPQPGPLVLG